MAEKKNNGGFFKLFIFIFILALVILFFIDKSKSIDHESIKHVNKELTEMFDDEFKESDEQEKIKICKDKLEDLEEEKYIKNINYNEKSKIYEFEYKSGALGGVLIEPFREDCNSVTKNYATKNANGIVSSVNRQVPLEYSKYPYNEKNLNAQFYYGLGFNDVLENIKEREKVYDDEYLSTSIDDDVTVYDLKNTLKGKKIIAIEEHGCFYIDEPIICTREKVTSGNQKLYEKDIKNKNILMLIYEDESEAGAYYCIRPQFFTSTYKKDELNGSLVYLGCCKGYYNDKLVKAISEAGADCVIANTDTVYTWYDARVQDAFIYALLCGDTADEALEYAKSIWGENDIVFANNYINTTKVKPEVATPKIYCGKNFRLVTLATNKDENETPQISKSSSLSYDQALKEGEKCYKLAYESYWGMNTGEDITSDMSYINVTNMTEIKKRFTQNGFDEFCKYNEIKYIGGTYYKVWGDRGSNIYYTGHELSLNIDDITENKITFTAIERYNDSEWPTQRNKFVIVNENDQWLIDEYTLPD